MQEATKVKIRKEFEIEAERFLTPNEEVNLLSGAPLLIRFLIKEVEALQTEVEKLKLRL
mgnify:CR=1 FL=1